MKKFLIIFTAVLLLFAGCGRDEHVADGTYIAYSLHADESLCPYIDINREDKTFVQGASMMYSFALYGDYEIKGDVLTLIPRNESGVMVFAIEGSKLIFDAEKTTTFLLYSEAEEIEDGTVFSPMKKP